jgi:hypothetical protein
MLRLYTSLFDLVQFIEDTAFLLSAPLCLRGGFCLSDHGDYGDYGDVGDYMSGFHALHCATVNGASTPPSCSRITASVVEQKLFAPVLSTVTGVAVAT